MEQQNTIDKYRASVVESEIDKQKLQDMVSEPKDIQMQSTNLMQSQKEFQ